MKEYVFFVLLLFVGSTSCGQENGDRDRTDTIKITLQEAEIRFLDNNLELLAQRHNVGLAEAELVTAKLYDNPEFSLSNSVYNPTTGRFFDYEVNAEYAQLIRLAGKRKKEISLAKSEIEIAEQEFLDILRTLRYQLRHTFYKIYFQQESIDLFDNEIASLRKIVNAYSDQVGKGNVAKIDLMRIRSQLYSLQAERDHLINELNDWQADFKILTKADPMQFYIMEYDGEMQRTIGSDLHDYQNLIDSAMAYRPDLKSLDKTIRSAHFNVQLQRAEAKPDITVSAIYQRQGGFVPDYNALGISIPLPFFNRNQGNIRAAKTKVEIEKINYRLLEDQIKAEIVLGLENVSRAGRLLDELDPDFQSQQAEMLEQVNDNFTKGYLSLLEFLDFYSAFKENRLRINQLKSNYAEALEHLNFVVGKVLF